MPKKNIEKITANIKLATPYRNIFTLILDIFLHKLLVNTDPRDYFKYSFFKPGKSLKEKSRYISFNGSMYFPYENNPFKYSTIFTNKYVQKKILHHFNLPTPDLISTIGEKKDISTKKQLDSFLEPMESDIVIKLISGTHGDGFLSLSPNGKSFLAGDRNYSKDDVWAHVNTDLRSFKNGYLVEEKITNSDFIRSIYPNSLNTFRIVMIKTHDNKWHNPCSVLRFGKGLKQVDNGQIFIFVDPSGKSTGAYDITTSNPVTHHPDSGSPLVGIKLTEYQKIINLAIKASKDFNFMGALGWDIASTDKGPLILEVNAWWGHDALQKAMGRGIITDKLAEGLKKRTFLHRWDKTMMYPNFNKEPYLGKIRKILGR